MEFHGLPPLKRFRLVQQEEAREHEDDTVTSSRLPAKKRKESRDLPAPLSDPAASTTTTYCLPAKKRVWALQPNFIPDNPISPFDLNVEYKPSFDEPKSDSQEANDAENGNDNIKIPEEMEEKGDETEEEEEDDGIECAICQSTDGDPSDPIVFCDGCDLMVHTTCYGYPLIKGVPDGDWFCAQCLISQSNQIETCKGFSCCLCPVTGGAMKLTSDGRWAHIVCALLIPEAFFGDPEGREGIDCSRVPPRRWEQRCFVCKSANGCVIDCSEPNCTLAFHVTCGLKEELSIEYKVPPGRSKEAIVAGFCKSHTELWKKQQQTGKFKIVAREEPKK